MFKLHAVQAQFGDSLIVEFGTAAKPRFILIDGGPPDTFKNSLADALKTIVKSKKLDLLVLSHIDADHIFGLLDLLAALEEDAANGNPPRLAVGGLWHNSFQKSIDTTGEITQRMQMLMTIAGAAAVAMPFSTDALFGLREGNRLRTFSKKLKLPLNKGFQDDLVMLETAQPQIKFGSLTFRVIGPNKANLEELRKEWIKWLAKTEQDAISDPATLANADKSVPNLSSIVLLAECEGKTILLTGDARSDHTLDGLAAAGLLTNGKMHIDVLKVAHHGSNRNVTSKFFKTITADTYVISANGKDDNPDFDTLKWMVEAAKSGNRKIDIVVTNSTPSTDKLLTTHKPDDFGYRLIVKPASKKSIAVKLA